MLTFIKKNFLTVIYIFFGSATITTGWMYYHASILWRENPQRFIGVFAGLFFGVAIIAGIGMSAFHYLTRRFRRHQFWPEEFLHFLHMSIKTRIITIVGLTLFFIGSGLLVKVLLPVGGSSETVARFEPAKSLEQTTQGGNGKFRELIFVEDSKNNQVIALDTNGKIIKRIAVGKEPHDIAVSPDNTLIATANKGDGTVTIIDTKTLSIQNSIITDKGAHGVVFSPDGKFIFVANSMGDTLSIIETKNFSQQTKISAGEFPEYVGVTKDGLKFFTVNPGKKGAIFLYDNNGMQSQVIRKIRPNGIDPRGWAASPDSATVAITNMGNDLLYFFDSNIFREISHFTIGTPSEFATFLDDDELWVTNINSHYVSIIDVAQKKVVKKIDVGEMPHGIVFSSDKLLAFVPLYESGKMLIISVKERTIINQIKIGEQLHNAVMASLKV